MMKIWNLDLKSLAITLSTILGALTIASCVDNDYNLDNISPEITIGGKEVIVPITTIDPIKLSSLLGDELEGLYVENGGYVFRFAGENESFSIDGFSLPTLTNLSKKNHMTFQAPSLPTDFLFSEIASSFELGYPDMNVAPIFSPIEISSGIELGVNLPNGMTVPALGELSFNGDGKVQFPASFDIPEQIRSIGKIFLGNAKSTLGSPIEVALEFKGLKSINGGGKLNFQAVFPSNYALADANGKSIGNVLKVENYAVKAGVESVVVKAYLQSMDLSKNTISQGKMNINDEISYQFNYTFESVSGYCNASNTPQFRLDVTPEFRDMEIVLNAIAIDSENHSSEVVYTLNGIPESIQSIDYIAFESAPVKMRVEGMSWFNVDGVNVEVQMPDCFVFEKDANGWLDASTNKMIAPLNRLESGVVFNLKAIDLKKGKAQLKSGQLTIAAAISSHVSDLKGGEKLLLSDVLPPSNSVKISTVIEETRFQLDFSKCQVVMNEQYFDFKLDESQLPSLEHTISVPDELVSVDRLELQTPKGEKVKVRLGISHPKDELFPVDEVALTLTVNLKKMIHPTEGQEFIEKAANGDYILRIDRKKWRPNENPKMDFVEIEIDAIENLPEITGPKGAREMVINEKFAVTGGVSIDAGTNVNLASSSARLDIEFALDDAQISKFYGKVDYQLQPDNLPELELGDIAASGLVIDNLDISPIVRFDISNPIDVPLDVNLALNPYDASGNLMEANKVEISDVHIVGLGQTSLVLTTRDRRDQFAGMSGITFVEADLAKIFKGTLPSKIAIDMKVATDLSVTHVVDLSQSSYDINYGYSVELPLEFGRDFDISYEQEINLGELLSDDTRFEPAEGYEGDGDVISILDFIEVGEVAILADFATTIPLDLILNAECLDKSGNPSKAQITFEDNNNIIHGFHPDSKKSEALSTLVLKLDLGKEGKFETLAEIDKLRLRLNLRNNSDSASSLSPDQTIAGKLRLRVRDGITANFDKIME